MSRVKILAIIKMFKKDSLTTKPPVITYTPRAQLRGVYIIYLHLQSDSHPPWPSTHILLPISRGFSPLYHFQRVNP